MTSISVSSLCNDDIVPYSECLITIPLFSNSLYFITFSLSVALLEQYAIKSLSSVMLFRNRRFISSEYSVFSMGFTGILSAMFTPSDIEQRISPTFAIIESEICPISVLNSNKPA